MLSVMIPVLCLLWNLWVCEHGSSVSLPLGVSEPRQGFSTSFLVGMQLVNTVMHPDPASRLQSVSNRCNIVSPCLFMIIVVMGSPPWSVDLITLSLVLDWQARSHNSTGKISSWNRKFYADSFFSSTSWIWDTLPASCGLRSSKN